MSVFRKQGPLKHVGGYMYFESLQVKKIDLRPVSRITYKFDPFREDSMSFRRIMWLMSYYKIRQTNYKCMFKTEIVCDRSEPEMLCKLENGKEYLFKPIILTPLEVFEELNRIIEPLLPPPEDVSAQVTTKQLAKLAKPAKRK